ncbi:MAG: serine hydrolase domain-containing protein [Eisenbergiella massiliensis]
MADFKELSRLLEEILEQGPAGCGCAVARNGEILFEEYHGVKDLESGEPITADGVYRQYSTTKVAVCTGAMMLLERGKFLLNDPIYEYFPEWKDTMVAQPEEDGSYRVRPAKRPILIRDCFSMAMGIGYGGTDYTHQAAEKVRAQLRANVGEYTLQQEIKAMAEVPVAFDPGTHWLYGFGHELVAGLIEVVSGKGVGQFLKEELFEPLDMKNTGYHYFGDIRERMVTTYLLKEDGSREASPYFQRDELFEPEAKYEGGGAGLFSTVRDYLALTQMLACGGEYQGRKIMGRKTIDLMRCNQLNEQQLKEFRNPYLEGYGYGCGVRTLMDPSAGVNSSVGEFGWTGMLGSYVSIDPAEKLSLVYMHNLFPNREAYIHPRIRNIVYGVL